MVTQSRRTPAVPGRGSRSSSSAGKHRAGPNATDATVDETRATRIGRVAHAALAAGLNVLPPKEDGTKAPDVHRWVRRQKVMASEAELDRWYAGGRSGIGVVCGEISGGLEMLEFEGRAVDEDLEEQFFEAAFLTGLGSLVLRIVEGYFEMTPSGGYHLLYRCSTPRSHPLARRTSTAAELASAPQQKTQVLMETKGEGGYTITAPSYGSVHQSGRPWVLLRGGWDTIATIDDDEHRALLNLARSFDQIPAKAPVAKSPEVSGSRPGDVFNLRADWAADVLEPAGWRHLFNREDGTQYWQRPDKSGDEASATVGHGGHDMLYVFSTSTPFPDVPGGYGKFSAYAYLHHGGDFTAAAESLHEKGYRADAPPGDRERFVLRSMDQVEMRPVRWLWPNLIPFGKLTTAEGDPESGKSLFTLDLAARITQGRALPDGVIAPLCAVLAVCDEDDYEDTIVPRLFAAGADCSRVFALFVQKNDAGEVLPLVIPDDMGVLDSAIRDVAAATVLENVLVIVDPATAYLSEKINSNNDASVRRAMSPLAQLARDTGAAILLVRHLNKNSSEKNHKYRGGGSIAFFAAARASLMFGRHPDDPSLMVMAQAKKNIAIAMPSLAYRMVSWEHDKDLPVIEWTGKVDVDAATVLGGRDARTQAPDRDEAMEVINELLRDGDGAVAAKEALKVCGDLGISKSTVKRAVKQLGLGRHSQHRDDGTIEGWVWTHPVQGSKIRIQAKAPDQGSPEAPR